MRRCVGQVENAPLGASAIGAKAFASSPKPGVSVREIIPAVGERKVSPYSEQRWRGVRFTRQKHILPRMTSSH
ncbi:MAG: hypothetical protein ACLVEJ_18260 [Parabacteroides sp.]